MRTTFVALSVFVASMSWGAAGLAQEVSPAPPPASATPRGWLFVDDATVPDPLHTLTLSRVTFTSSGTSPTRPFATDVAHPGGAFETGAEAGLLPSLSVFANGMTTAPVPDLGGSSGMLAGLRLGLLDAGGTRAVMSGGYLQELGGAGGVWGRLSLSRDVGTRLRLATTVHGEHVFAPGRDSLDVMVMSGMS